MLAFILVGYLEVEKHLWYRTRSQIGKFFIFSVLFTLPGIVLVVVFSSVYLSYFLDLDTGISSGSGGGSGGHRLGCRSAAQRPAELSLRALNLPAGGTPCRLHHQQRGTLSVRSQGGASSVSSSSRAGSTAAGPAPRTLPPSIR